MKRWVLWILGVILVTGCSFRQALKEDLSLVNQVFYLFGLAKVENRHEMLELASEYVLTPEQRLASEFSPLPMHDLHGVYDGLSQLRMTQDVPSYRATYDSAVILCGALPTIRQRLDFLAREWERGVRFGELIFLSGQRSLYSGVEDKDQFFDARYNPFPIEPNWDKDAFAMPASEEDIARFVWEQMRLPPALRSEVKVVFLYATSLTGKYASLHETLEQLVAYKGGKVENTLFISSQPFIHLDRCRIDQHCARDGYDIAGAGFSQSVLKQPWAPALCLHGLAGWIKESNGYLDVSLE